MSEPCRMRGCDDAPVVDLAIRLDGADIAGVRVCATHADMLRSGTFDNMTVASAELGPELPEEEQR